MIKHIIVVDDSEYKRNSIIKYMQKLFPNATITAFSNTCSILCYITREHYNEIKENPNEHLVITDMVMPFRDGDFPERENGFFVLSEMDRLELSCPTIITSSEKIDEEKAREMYEQYIGFVKEDISVYTYPLYENLLKSYMN